MFVMITLHVSLTVGPQRLSAAVLSPTSVHLTWVAPCHTQQYHIYYRGTCGTYVDEGRLDTSHQEYTLDELQEGVNYTLSLSTRLGSVEVGCSPLAQCMQGLSQQVAK